MSAERDAVIGAFLKRHGWHQATRRRLAGDASFRSYDRLEGASGRAVLMNAPPAHEDVRPFVRIARHLLNHGFSAPRVMAEDAVAGLLLLEDLGDDTYTRLLARGHDERQLYALAIDALIALHRLPGEAAVPAGVPPYDAERMLDEVGRLPTWYVPLIGAALPPAAVAAYESAWRTVLALPSAVPTALVLLDYHVDNLLLVPDRPGIRACGILDFQDAVAGPITYDLMSLLEDARRDIDPGLVADMKQRYQVAFPALDAEAFARSWAVMAAQRHVRVIGTFARLKLRDNKPHYLQHLPRLWRYLDACLAHPSLDELRAWFDRYMPEELRGVPT